MTAARTAFISHPDCARHETGLGHPENARRLEAIDRAMADLAEAEPGLAFSEAGKATHADLELVHPAEHVTLIEAAAQRAQRDAALMALDADTLVSPGSWDAALAAAGAVLTAVDAVLDGSVANAFCAVRPPGHHATAQTSMGFCLFNNVAIGVAHARRRGLRRALIVDWDVHHGNGTEAIFYTDPDVFYLSMHQSPHYPGTGARDTAGVGAGAGTTLNLPVPPSQPPDYYTSTLQAGIEEALTRFDPDVVFVSAGFDAALGDPLAGLTLRPEDYHELTLFTLEATSPTSEGRLISVLEGGYDLANLAECSSAHVQALLAVSRKP